MSLVYRRSTSESTQISLQGRKNRVRAPFRRAFCDSRGVLFLTEKGSLWHYLLSNLLRLRRSMDRTKVSGTFDVGSIPAGATQKTLSFLQEIERF